MIGPEITAPDFTETVVGYRRFALKLATQHNYVLVSPHTEDCWTGPEKTARCNREMPRSEHVVLDGIRPKQHPAPQKNCGCGIYAYFDPCPMLDYELQGGYSHYRTLQMDCHVATLVTLEGRIEVHDRGMRAARAKICAIGTHPYLGQDRLAALREIAKQWGVALVPQEQLPGIASEYGRELGKEHRPSGDEMENPEEVDPFIAAAQQIMADYKEAVTPRRRGLSKCAWTRVSASAAAGGAITQAVFTAVDPSPSNFWIGVPLTAYAAVQYTRAYYMGRKS